MAPPRAVVLVTGCSSGIGRACVVALRRAGCLVVATARRPETIADLAEPGAVEVLPLDVASDAQRAAAVQEVLRRHGRIDALVNNAGYGLMVAAEETTPDALRALFEVNVVGLHDLARRVLPAMRRQGHGRIVNVASVAGHVALPAMGAYCASKFAVRALTQSLDMEVRRFGIRAVLVEPGPIATRFGERATAETRASVADPQASPYAPLYRRWAAYRSRWKSTTPAERVARRVVHACLSASPRNHSFVPWWAHGANLAKRLLPDAWTMAVLRAYYRGR